jgi:hypothetical protein
MNEHPHEPLSLDTVVKLLNDKNDLFKLRLRADLALRFKTERRDLLLEVARTKGIGTMEQLMDVLAFRPSNPSYDDGMLEALVSKCTQELQESEAAVCAAFVDKLYMYGGKNNSAHKEAGHTHYRQKNMMCASPERAVALLLTKEPTHANQSMMDAILKCTDNSGDTVLKKAVDILRHSGKMTMAPQWNAIMQASSMKILNASRAQ